MISEVGLSPCTESETASTAKNEIVLDCGMMEDFEMSVIAEVAILREKLEVVQFLHHFPCPQPTSGQYIVSLCVRLHQLKSCFSSACIEF